MKKDIAIIGISTLMPGSKNFKDFIRDIFNKKDYIREVPKEYWEKEDYYDKDPKKPGKIYCTKGAFLDPTDFNPIEFGIPPNILSSVDSEQILSLIVAKKVYEDATKNSPIDPKDVSVILGSTASTKLFAESVCQLEYPKIEKAMKKVGIEQDKIDEVIKFYREQFVLWTENTFPGLLPNVISGRITNRLNFGGENSIVDAACASSLAAINYAIQKLLTNQSKMVITGGVDTMNGIPMFMCFSKTPALSPTMEIRPFDQNGDGTLLGEGIAMIALKTLENAEKDKDQIYAVIKGIGTSSDGRAKSIYSPDPKGQILAMTRCYEDASYDPSTVGLVEGHGTGTKVGDKAELESMSKVFKDAKCAVGSLKSQYAHTKGAAGACSLAKVVGGLVNKVLPPTIKSENPINIKDASFYINTKTRPWFLNKNNKRRASVSSFGFGGANYHMTVEEYTGPLKVKKSTNFPFTIFPISANSKKELDKKIKKLHEDFKNSYVFSEFLDNMGYMLQNEYDHQLPYRFVILASNPQTFEDQIFDFHHRDNFYSEGDPLEADSINLNSPDQFDTFAAIDIVNTFDLMREYFDNEEDILSKLFPISNNVENINDTGIKEKLLESMKILFESFGIKVKKEGVEIHLTKDLSLSFFMKTIAQLSSKGIKVNYALIHKEYLVQYNQDKKPGFSIPIAGYNYGKPKESKLNKEIFNVRAS